MQLPDRIILIGPSGSGKSALAEVLADQLGYSAVDTDALIVDRIGMPISAFFERFGEPAFRAIETQIIEESVARSRAVIATGGGAPLSQRNWVAWRSGGVVIGLTAGVETLVSRVREQASRAGAVAGRPLLAGNAVERMTAMLGIRSEFYQQSDATIDTEASSMGEVADRVVDAVRLVVSQRRVPRFGIVTPPERSEIYVASGSIAAIPTLINRRWASTRAVWIITDENVAAHWLEPITALMAGAGYRVQVRVIPPGEDSKSMTRVAELCDALTINGAGRRDVVIALGGGVVGDLAGFVAAISLRGLGLVQVPTSLLAMVDSSVGGKTGVNSPAGKNMIGAFYQPGIVVADPEVLTTLPAAESRSGMAEVIKHSVIQPSTPLGGDSLSQLLDGASCLDPITGVDIDELLALNVEIKRSVVQADERESGLRMILNFGHTAGHAIEADGFRYRHGEAVALGMLVASDLAVRMGRVDERWVESLFGRLTRAGLPTTVEGRVDDILPAMSRDKKAVDGMLTWILPAGSGGVEMVRDVPISLVKQALQAVGAT